ncbi:MAG TPA: DUF2723 domain-containing protein [Armatimonadota bacterium]|nr:DUF2723 domain-containing protein [Armatimonadota bacterium]
MTAGRSQKQVSSQLTADPTRPRAGEVLRRPFAVAALVGSVSLAIYVWTLAPTVLADDSAELVTAAHVLGIPHPTGYPLYLLLARLFDLLPFAAPPVRVGLLSALCGAASAAVIAWTATRIAGSAPAGLLSGFVVAFAGSGWSAATEPEVYALNALIISLAIAVFAAGGGRRGQRRLLWLALLAGLGLAHHRTSVFFTIPLVIAAAVEERPGWRALGKATAFGLAPLLLYLYLPIRAAAHPPVLWSDVSQWRHFLPYVLGRSYQEYVFARPPGEMIGFAETLLAGASSELTPGGIILSLIGAAGLVLRRRGLGIALLVSTAALTIWNLGYRVSDWQAFSVPSTLAAGLWSGLGLVALSQALRRAAPDRTRWAQAALTIGVVVFIPASLLQSNLPKSHRGEWQHYDTALAVLSQLPPNSIYVSNLDHGTFLPMYLQVVEGRRRDVVVCSSDQIYEPWTYDPAISPAIAELLARWDFRAGPSQEARSEDSLAFAAALGESIGWSRPISCLAYVRRPPATIPAIALWSDLFRITKEEPGLLISDAGGPPVAEYDNGISLLRAEARPDGARPRDLLRFTLDWRCTEPVERSPFMLLSLAHVDESGTPIQPKGMLLRYGTWFAYGRAPLPPTVAGSVYRQEFVGIAPTHAPPGRWIVRVGLAENMDDPVTVQEVADFRVISP